MAGPRTTTPGSRASAARMSNSVRRQLHRRVPSTRTDRGAPRRARARPADTWPRPATRPRPAQERLDARHQLARAEGLGQVVVGTDGEADDPVDLLAPRGEHQHVGVGERADLPARPRRRRGPGSITSRTTTSGEEVRARSSPGGPSVAARAPRSPRARGSPAPARRSAARRPRRARAPAGLERLGPSACGHRGRVWRICKCPPSGRSPLPEQPNLFLGGSHDQT